MDIHTTSFWQKADGRTVRICYISPVSWKYTMMADVDLQTEEIREILSDDENNKHLIAKFSLDILNDEKCEFWQLSLTGCDRSIIDHARSIIEKFRNRYRILKIHVAAAMEDDYRYKNASSLLQNDIRREMLAAYEAEADTDGKQAFYCGATGDLDLKIKCHRTKDFGIAGDRVYAWKCVSQPVAKSIYEWAAEEGFDTREDRESLFEEKNVVVVYLLKKSGRIQQP